jgi:hypothetical protein
MISRWITRRFAPRIAELEQQNRDLLAIIDERYGDVSLTHMEFDPRTGLETSFRAGLGGRLIAEWAFNTLKAVDAENYVEMTLVHPEAGAIVITLQRLRGETPGAKAARLEREIAGLREITP